MTVDQSHIDIFSVLPGRYQRVAGTDGGEYAGECPFCGGHDRFRVWPHSERNHKCWCRVCEKSWDAIGFVREYHNLGFAEALHHLRLENTYGTERRETPIWEPKPVKPPCDAWQARMRSFVAWAQGNLDTTDEYLDGLTPLAWLQRRGLSEDTIRGAGIGFNADKIKASRARIGHPDGVHPETGEIIDWYWFWPGLVIPNEIDGALWGVTVRTPWEVRYLDILGSQRALYNADYVAAGQPCILVEGAFDVLAIQQEAGDIIAPVAPGTTGARSTRWIMHLSRASHHLIAFDNEPPKKEKARETVEQAIKYWTDALQPNAVRHVPVLCKDAGDMLQNDVSIREWICAGLGIDAATARPDAMHNAIADEWPEAHDMRILRALLSRAKNLGITIPPDEYTNTTDIAARVAHWRAVVKAAAQQQTRDSEIDWTPRNPAAGKVEVSPIAVAQRMREVAE